MSKNLKLISLIAFVTVTLLFANAVTAQTNTTGTVEGVVADPNGAVVPNATITLSGPNLIRAQTTTSGADGTYRFASVPPGRYTLKSLRLPVLTPSNKRTSRST